MTPWLPGVGNSGAVHPLPLLPGQELFLVWGPDRSGGVSGCLKFSAGFGRHVTFFRAKILIFQPHFLSSVIHESMGTVLMAKSKACEILVSRLV